MPIFIDSEERGVEHSFQQLTFLGVEQPEDLLYLFMEDLVEFGIPKQDADRIMIGIHPPGTRRPDNPNNSGLTTGEVRMFDREQRQIPWVMQNRSLSQRNPGPPMPNLGVRTDQQERERQRHKREGLGQPDPKPEERPSSSSTAAWLDPNLEPSQSQPDRFWSKWSTPNRPDTWSDHRPSTSSPSRDWSDDRWSASASSGHWDEERSRASSSKARAHQPSASSSGSSWDGNRWSKPSSNWQSNRGSSARANRDWDNTAWYSSAASSAWQDNRWQSAASSDAWRGSEWRPNAMNPGWDDEWQPNQAGNTRSDEWSIADTQPSWSDWQTSQGDDPWGTEWRPTAPTTIWEEEWQTEAASNAENESSIGVDAPCVASTVSETQDGKPELNDHPGHVWEDEWTAESMPVGWVAPWTTTMPPAAFPSPPGSPNVSVNASSSTQPGLGPTPGASDGVEYQDPPWLQTPSDPQVRVVQVEGKKEPYSPRVKKLCPQACEAAPGQVYESLNCGLHIGVHFPEVVTVHAGESELKVEEEAQPSTLPGICKVTETAFTPNIEELLTNLTGPLEVVHQVSPSEVKRHLERWVSAAQDEVDSLEGMQAIKRHRGQAAQKLVRDPGVEVLPAKAVFTVKPGKPFRRKVRVVSCGNFAKTIAEDVLYASGAAAETLRTILVYAGSKRRSAWATDIKNAFLLAPIPNTATKRYALRPPAILIALGICDPSEIWEVCRALYGFKEAPKWWSQYRDEVLGAAEVMTHLGRARLKRTICDENLWRLVLDDDTCIAHVLVYVDDLLILAEQLIAKSLYEWVKGKWQCSELEQAQAQKPLRFLGVDLYETRDGLGACGFGLAQEGYIDELVRSHNLSPCARAVVPVPKEWVKDAPPEEKGYEESVLRDAERITGELLWVSQRTRIDICFGVGLMSSWTVRSPSFVTKLGLRILAYLARTKGLKLDLTPCQDKELEIYTDASFAPFSDRSISGIVVQLRGKSIFWKSRRQTLVSLSTAESELIAACEGVVLGQSIEALVSELFDCEVNKELKVDNVAAITLAEGDKSQRTRHLRVRANFLKEMIDRDCLRVTHCPGEVQLADALTKALAAPRLEGLNDMLGIRREDPGDLTVRALNATSNALHNFDSRDGQSIILVLVLLMMQVQPVTSQDDGDENEELSLDLWIVGSLMAFIVLFVWEIGKHCLRECVQRRSTPSINSVQLSDDETRQRRERREQAVRQVVEREAEEGLRRRSQPSASSTAPDEVPIPSFLERGSHATSHVHVHLSPSTSSPVVRQQDSPSNLDLRNWNFASNASSPTPVPPPPPPIPVPEVQDRTVRNSQNRRSVATQTSGPTGLSDQQLCELEVITTTSRSPGALHIFPDCHALRNTTSTNRRMFCRYCLLNLRQQGTR